MSKLRWFVFGLLWSHMATTNTAPSSSGSENSTNTQTLRVSQIAKLAGVHPVSVRRAIKRGDLKPIGSFRHKIVSKDAVEAWIAGRKEETNEK